MWPVVALCGAGAAAAWPADPPRLTPVEQLRVENINLRDELRTALLEADTCRGQLAPLRATALQQTTQAAVAALKTDIERTHPGYTWEPTSGAFTPIAGEGGK